MVFSSRRRYSMDKKDLSTPLLEGTQKFLYSKKNPKSSSKKEFSNQGETAASMQTNITKCQNKMTLKSDYARNAKELKKVALGRPLREVSHWVPYSALVTRAGFRKCVCLLVLGQPAPRPKPTGTQGMCSKGVWMLQQSPLWAFLEAQGCPCPTAGTHKLGRSFDVNLEALPGHGSDPGKWKMPLRQLGAVQRRQGGNASGGQPLSVEGQARGHCFSGK